MDKQAAVHIIPLRVYLGIGGTLLFLTLVTVMSASIDLGVMNIVIALGIATVKAILVGLFFMHLFYDNKLYAYILAVALFFLSSLIVLTLADTLRRGDIYEYMKKPIQENAEKMIHTTPAETQH